MARQPQRRAPGSLQPFVTLNPEPIISKYAPTVNDTGYARSTQWIQQFNILGEAVNKIWENTGDTNGQANWQLLTGSGGSYISTINTIAPNTSDDFSLTAGSGITLTPITNGLTIAASGGGGGIVTIQGDTDSVTGTIVFFEGEIGGATLRFIASGPIMQLFTTDSSANTIIGAGGSANSPLLNSTALGYNAFYSCNWISGSTDNIAIGYGAMSNIVTLVSNPTSYNVAIGSSALAQSPQSQYVIAIGNNTAFDSGTVSSIYLNNPSYNISSNTLAIGAGTGTGIQELNSAFICGIQTIVVAGTPVLVSTGDQLGVASSSARYKKDIQDMSDDSNGLLSLRPVTFLINKDSAPGLKNAPDERQYGLIAEEVAHVMPLLVNFNKEGQPESVKYEVVPSLLINELQKALKRIDQLENHLDRLLTVLEEKDVVEIPSSLKGI